MAAPNKPRGVLKVASRYYAKEGYEALLKETGVALEHSVLVIPSILINHNEEEGYAVSLQAYVPTEHLLGALLRGVHN